MGERSQVVGGRLRVRRPALSSLDVPTTMAHSWGTSMVASMYYVNRQPFDFKQKVVQARMYAQVQLFPHHPLAALNDTTGRHHHHARRCGSVGNVEDRSRRRNESGRGEGVRLLLLLER